MPFALVFIGLVLLAAGVRDKTGELFTLVKGDVEGGYVKWIVAILIIGAIGYVKQLESFSRVFLALVIVVLFLKAGNPQGLGGGFFSQFFSAINQSPQDTTGVSSITPIGGITGASSLP